MATAKRDAMSASLNPLAPNSALSQAPAPVMLNSVGGSPSTQPKASTISVQVASMPGHPAGSSQQSATAQPANPFDQFADPASPTTLAATAGGNPFDQFSDAPGAPANVVGNPAAGGMLAIENGLTFNNADRVNGAANAAATYLGAGQKGVTPGQAYAATSNAVNQEDQQFDASHPYASFALNLLGGLPLGGALAKGVAKIPTVAGKVAEAVGSGAATGAAYGAGANKADPVQGVVTGGATGALAGPLALGLGKVASTAGNAVKKSQFGQNLQTIAERYLSPGAAPLVSNSTTSTGPGRPSTLGSAATPSAAIPMTPAEATAARATAENYRVNNPLPGRPDATVYVPGTQPTAAEVAANPTVSQLQKVTMQAPGNQTPFTERQAANNDARLNLYDDLAGTPTMVNRLQEARTAQMNQDLAQAWRNKTPVDATPVLDTLNGLLNGPDGKITAVRSALSSVKSNLFDTNGNLESDPQVLYGVRKDVANMLGKNATSQNPTLRDAAVQLGNVKDALDSTIEQGANGYGQYLSNYSAASKPIDAANLLLDARPDLTNGAARQMSFPKFDRFMKGIVSDRQSFGQNPAKSIPDETMDQLWNLHSDLARTQNMALGNPDGSPTSMLQRATSGGVKLAGHVVAAHTHPVLGNVAVHFLTEKLDKRAVAKTTASLLNPAERYLDPSYGKSFGVQSGLGGAIGNAAVPGAVGYTVSTPAFQQGASP